MSRELKPPCETRGELFELYKSQEETDGQRGHRIPLALAVCETCPLNLKKRCAKTRPEGRFGHIGIWGGEIGVKNEG